MWIWMKYIALLDMIYGWPEHGGIPAQESNYLLVKRGFFTTSRSPKRWSSTRSFVTSRYPMKSIKTTIKAPSNPIIVPLKPSFSYGFPMVFPSILGIPWFLKHHKCPINSPSHELPLVAEGLGRAVTKVAWPWLFNGRPIASLEIYGF